MKKARKILAILLVAAMLLTFFAACSNNEQTNKDTTTNDTQNTQDTTQDTTQDAATGDQPVYKVGLAAMLTGDNALNGERMQNASQMVIDQYNEDAGYEKFVLYTEDDLTSTEGALTAVQKLISDGCLAIVGPHRSSNALAVSDTVRSSGVSVLVGGTAVSIDGSNEYMFRTRASDALMAQVAAVFCNENLSAKKVGILHASDEYGQGGADAAMAYFDSVGIEYVDQPHNVNDVDFTSAILACNEAGCDLIFIWTHDAEMAIIFQQLNTYMPDVQVVGSPGATLANVLNLCEDEWVDGCYSVTDFISTSTEQVVVDFVTAYEEKYNDTPDLYAAAYYGAAVTICEAILAAEAAGEVTPATVRDYIAQTSDLELPSGVFYCDDKNDLVHSCTIAVLNGKTPEFFASVSE